MPLHNVPKPFVPPAVPRPRGRPPLAQADVSRRREKIVEAAARLFFTDGFVETKLESVAREVGITKRAIYELFGDKNALFLAACNTLRVKGPMFAFDISVTGRSVREVLRDMGRQLIDHALDEDLIALERAVVIEAARSKPAVRRLIQEAVGSGKLTLDDAVGKVFQEMTTLGMIPTVNFAEAAYLFYDLMVGASGMRAMLGYSEGPVSDAYLDSKVDVFLAGYLDRLSA